VDVPGGGDDCSKFARALIGKLNRCHAESLPKGRLAVILGHARAGARLPSGRKESQAAVRGPEIH
jgi:hypothetical protein